MVTWKKQRRFQVSRNQGGLGAPGGEGESGTHNGWEETTVVLPMGVDLHARPAAELVHTAMPFDATIRIRSDDEEEADAKSLLAILALGARRGTSLCVRARVRTPLSQFRRLQRVSAA